MIVQHLKQISEKTPIGSYAVVIMDDAGWHTDDIASEFDNVAIIKLPPYSPELNPIEQVWQWLRQRHLYQSVLKCDLMWQLSSTDITTYDIKSFEEPNSTVYKGEER